MNKPQNMLIKARTKAEDLNKCTRFLYTFSWQKQSQDLFGFPPRLAADRDFTRSSDILQEDGIRFPTRPALRGDKHPLVLGIDPSSDLAFNEMRRRMNSFL